MCLSDLPEMKAVSDADFTSYPWDSDDHIIGHTMHIWWTGMLLAMVGLAAGAPGMMKRPALLSRYGRSLGFPDKELWGLAYKEPMIAPQQTRISRRAVLSRYGKRSAPPMPEPEVALQEKEELLLCRYKGGLICAPYTSNEKPTY
ncbi:unnamed protein product, partial [Mesorhabditis spiculigera]